eukprot:97120-Pelagomonas_calceolata.AAC.1
MLSAEWSIVPSSLVQDSSQLLPCSRHVYIHNWPQTQHDIPRKYAEQVLIFRLWPNAALVWFPVLHQSCLAVCKWKEVERGLDWHPFGFVSRLVRQKGAEWWV